MESRDFSGPFVIAECEQARNTSIGARDYEGRTHCSVLNPASHLYCAV
jgi:hypothetical protein